MSMKFKTQKIVTGVENRVSTKTNNPYTLITYLDDNGTTFSTITTENTVIPTGLKQLDKVDVEFEVLPGKYMQLKTLTIVKVA